MNFEPLRPLHTMQQQGSLVSGKEIQSSNPIPNDQQACANNDNGKDTQQVSQDFFLEIKNVDSLLQSLLTFYLKDNRNNYEYLYYYIFCFINLKANKMMMMMKKNEFQVVGDSSSSSSSCMDHFSTHSVTNTPNDSDEAQWLGFITSLAKPKAKEHFIGNEMEYSLDKHLKESEMDEIKNLFVNKYPNYDTISRTWYKLKPIDKMFTKNILIIKEIFKKSCMIMFYEKIKCIIRRDNIKDSWELKIKLEELKNCKDMWQVKIKACLEIPSFFGNVDEDRDNLLYLGSVPLLSTPPWSKMWIKNTDYYCTYPIGDTNQRLALDITNNKLKYECENQSYLNKTIHEMANDAHTAFINLLGSKYWT